MKGIEAAIRKALSKPGMADPQQRQRVYESARKALANGIEQQGLGGTDRAARQAELLEGLIGRIEDTFWAEPPPPDLGFDAENGDDDQDHPDDLAITKRRRRMISTCRHLLAGRPQETVGLSDLIRVLTMVRVRRPDAPTPRSVTFLLRMDMANLSLRIPMHGRSSPDDSIQSISALRNRLPAVAPSKRLHAPIRQQRLMLPAPGAKSVAGPFLQ